MEIGRGEGTVLVCMSSVMARAVSCITRYGFGLAWTREVSYYPLSGYKCCNSLEDGNDK
jgi:hypothetical protein